MARVDLRDNEYMEKFVGQDHIDSNDAQFWYQLLSCSFNFMRVQDPKVVDKTLDPYLVRLSLNNKHSLNIGSLVRVFLDRVSRIKSQGGQSTNSYFVFQAFNGLYLIRTICKSYIETISEEQLIKSFRARVDPAIVPQASQKPLPPPNASPPTLPPAPPSDSQQSQQNIGQSLQQDTQSVPTPIQQPDINAISQPPTSDSDDTNRAAASQKSEITPGTSMLDQFVESINALLILLSVQMYSTTPANQSTIYKCLMQKKCSIHALILTKTLLNNFVRQDPMPQETGSIILGLASGLWRVLTLGYGGSTGSGGTGLDNDEIESMPLLAKQSLLLLNILTNHYTNEKNPYREAMVSCQDSRYNLSDPHMAFENANNDIMATATTSKSALISNSIKVDFRELYETICKYLHNDQVALLLYLLLHSNKIFRPYILTTASKEIDKLLLPLLKILYLQIEKGSHHVYMVLIIFIILSEETTFNEAIHKIIIRGVPWYKDRILNEITLGSLTALIIIRSFQYNTFRIKDKFLHTNLFATLANLSNYFNNLHPYVCQRIVDLLERLSKRYLLATRPQNLTNNSKAGQVLLTHQTLDVLNADNPLAKALATDTNKQDIKDASSLELDSTSGKAVIDINIPDQQKQQLLLSNNNSTTQTSDQHSQDNGASIDSDNVNISIDDTKQDLSLIEEVIRMLLEVINNSLAAQLLGNTDLIYTLLYKRNVFSSLLPSHPSFYNMVINVERILTFFYNKIEAYERPLSVEEIKDLIQTESRGWNYEQTKDPSARLLFHYVEDEQPEEFFIPYIWTRIYYSSGIVWNSKRIILFNPDEL